MKIQPIINIKTYFKDKYEALKQQKPAASNPFLQTQSVDEFIKSQVNFKGHSCQKDEFKIKQFYNVPCPSCGKPMLLNNQLTSFISGVSKKTGDALIEELEKSREIYRPIEEQIVEIIKVEAKENPDLDIGELVTLEADKRKTELQNEQVAILHSLKEIAKCLDSYSDQKEFKTFIDENILLARKKDGEGYFKRKEFIANFNSLLSGFRIAPSKKKRYNQIREQVHQLPNSKSNVNAFFAKYARRSNGEIAARLVKPAIVTAEHILPHSKGGKNNTANYLCECNECNSKRGNTAFHIWASNRPELADNLQRYLNVVEGRILDAKLDSYYDYTSDIVETIKVQSQGNIILHIPSEDEIKHPLVLPPKEEEKKEDTVESIALQIDEIKHEIAAKQDEIEFLLARKERVEQLDEFKKYVRLLSLTKSAKDLEAARRTASKAYYAAKHAFEKELKPRQTQQDKEEQKRTMEAREKEFKIAKEKCDKINAELEEARTQIQPPDVLIPQVDALKGIIEQATSLEEEKIQLYANYKLIDEFNAKIAQIDTEIESLNKKAAGLKGRFSPDDTQSIADARTYRQITQKLEAIKMLSKQGSIKTTGDVDIDPIFIFDEARENLEAKQAAILASPSAMHAKTMDDIASLEEKREHISADIQKAKDELKGISKIEKSIKSVLGENTLHDLIEQKESLEEILERYREYDSVLNTATLVSRVTNAISANKSSIAILEQKADKLIQEQCGLEEQKRPEDENAKKLKRLITKQQKLLADSHQLNEEELHQHNSRLSGLSSIKSRCDYMQKTTEDLQDELQEQIILLSKLEAELARSSEDEDLLRKKKTALYRKGALESKIEKEKTNILKTLGDFSMEELDEEIKIINEILASHNRYERAMKMNAEIEKLRALVENS